MVKKRLIGVENQRGPRGHPETMLYVRTGSVPSGPSCALCDKLAAEAQLAESERKLREAEEGAQLKGLLNPNISDDAPSFTLDNWGVLAPCVHSVIKKGCIGCLVGHAWRMEEAATLAMDTNEMYRRTKEAEDIAVTFRLRSDASYAWQSRAEAAASLVAELRAEIETLKGK
jgi:hypothetical protein